MSRYLRFWDHILGGRNTLRLSIAPQDQPQLASSLYPIAWIAGRYGVDTAIEDGPVSENKTEQLASVQESFATPPSIANDGRLRWIMSTQSGSESHYGSQTLTTRRPRRITHLRPCSPFCPRIQLHCIFRERMTRRSTRLPRGPDLAETLPPTESLTQLSNRHVLQVLLLRGGSGQWQTQIFSSAL